MPKYLVVMELSGVVAVEADTPADAVARAETDIDLHETILRQGRFIAVSVEDVDSGVVVDATTGEERYEQ